MPNVVKSCYAGGTPSGTTASGGTGSSGSAGSTTPDSGAGTTTPPPVSSTDPALPSDILSRRRCRPAAYRSMASAMGKDGGLAYRYGPTPADYGTTGNGGLPTYAKRNDNAYVSDQPAASAPATGRVRHLAARQLEQRRRRLLVQLRPCGLRPGQRLVQRGLCRPGHLVAEQQRVLAEARAVVDALWLGRGRSQRVRLQAVRQDAATRWPWPAAMVTRAGA